MRKMCEKCGREFEAYQSHFTLCSSCFSSQKREDITGLFLNDYYDNQNNLLKKVFIGVPEELANIFYKEGLKAKQLRDFHQKILIARKKALLQGINLVRPLLYQCSRDLMYQLSRGVIGESFLKFMKHHLEMAGKDEKSLEGFYQHLDSIVCYFYYITKKKGGK